MASRFDVGNVYDVKTATLSPGQEQVIETTLPNGADYIGIQVLGVNPSQVLVRLQGAVADIPASSFPITFKYGYKVKWIKLKNTSSSATVTVTVIFGGESAFSAQQQLGGNVNASIQSPLDSSGNVLVNVNAWGSLPKDSSGYPYVDIGAKSNSKPKTSITVLNASAITANGSSSNYSAGAYDTFDTFIYVSAVSGTSPSLTVYFNFYDSVSGKSYPLANSGSITATGTYFIHVYDSAIQNFNVSWVVSGTSPSFTVTIVVYEGW
jgi:hypothetical protein